MRVVWLYGSPGVGKSTVAWQLYEELTAGGSRWGYVDIDQLGMCYPAGEDDPDRHRLKGSVLGALLPNYAAAGIRTLVVSGVLDPALAGWTSEQLVGAEMTFCRLVVGEQELRRRLDQRGGGELWDAVRRADQELDASGPLGPTVVTDGLDPSQVAAAVRIGVDLPVDVPLTCPAPPPPISPLSSTGARLRSAGPAPSRAPFSGCAAPPEWARRRSVGTPSPPCSVPGVARRSST